MSSIVNVNYTLGAETNKIIHRYEAIALSMQIVSDIEAFRKQRKTPKKDIAKASGVEPSYLSQVYACDKMINNREKSMEEL